MIENDPSARMQVRPVGELAHPASCCVCGSGNCEDGYLDLGVYYDYEGTMYLCKTCLYQAGETFGMFTPDEVMSQQQLLQTLRQERDQMQMELESALKYADSLNNVIQSRHYPSADAGSAGDLVTTPVVAESEGPKAGESEVKKPASSTGRANASGTKSGNRSPKLT